MRSRLGKVPQLVGHALKSRRRRLQELAGISPVARALIAAVADQFSPAERAVFSEIEAIRDQLYRRRDTFVWEIETPNGRAHERTGTDHQVVGARAATSSVKPHWGRLLYAIAREVQPAICVELGSCMGISGLYIQAGMPRGGQFVTFEGCKAMAEIASDNYRALGFDSFSMHVGHFDRTFAPAIASLPPIDLAFIDGNHMRKPTEHYDSLVREHASDGCVIIHDDIRWSPGMWSAWRTVGARPARQVFDIFRFGITEVGQARVEPVPVWLGLSHLR